MFAPLFALYLLLFPAEGSGFGRGSRSERSRLLAPIAAPFLLAAAFYVLQRRLGGPALIYGSTPPWVYLQTQVFAWMHYVRLFFLPMGLSADADWSPIEHAYDTRVIAGALWTLLLIGASILYWKRRPAGRAALYGVLWFYVALIPSSSVFPLSEMINEHRPYFPLIGLILAATAAAADAVIAARRKRPRVVLLRAALPTCVVILALHAAGTYARNRVWATDETLWRSVTEASPRNGRAWMNYGLVFMARADYPNARRCFERARESAPNYDVLEVNFGILEAATGNPGEAERHFQRAISLKSNLATAHFYYGRWLSESGRLDEATRHLELAVRQSPADLSARHLLLNVYERRGDDAKGCALARETVTVAPGDSRASDALQRRCRSD
jgi:tetratricopeptide (TPR) repeat protein